MEPDAQTSSSPAPQIRTYASDVAKLTGKPMPVGVKNEVADPRAPLPPPPAKILPNAPTTDEKREEVLARLKTRAVPSTTAPVPTAPAASVIPNAPTTDEKREEVLARLKAQASKPATTTVAPVTTPEFVPPAPLPEPLPGIPPVSKNVPPPSPIHTYTSDFADKTKAEGASPLSVLAAQADAGAVRAPEVLTPKRSSAPFFIAGAALLVIAGGASIFFAYQIISGRPTLPQELAVSSLIFADQRVELVGSSEELSRGLIKMGDAPLPDGGVAIAYMTYATTTNGKEVRVAATGGALIQALGLTAPSILLRNVAQDSTLGVVSAGGETRPFFLLRVTSFERTFAGMLDWESTMADDLSLYYPAYPIQAAIVSTSTASTTAPAQQTPPPTHGFMDVIIDNHDARIMKDGQGRTVLIYGYRDKQTLIIARNEAAFRELLSRLSSTSSR